MRLKQSEVVSFQCRTPESSTGLQFWLLHKRWQERIAKELKPLGINHTQFVILSAVLWFEENGSAPSQAEISQLTTLDKMTLSKSIKQLSERTLITKVKSDVDSRAFKIILMDKGKDLSKLALHKIEAIDRHIFGALGVERTRQFSQLLLDFNR